MSTTDLKSMTSKDRRILSQGITQAVIVAGIDPKLWEKAVARGVKVALRTLKGLDPNEKRGKKNGN